MESSPASGQARQALLMKIAINLQLAIAC